MTTDAFDELLTNVYEMYGGLSYVLQGGGGTLKPPTAENEQVIVDGAVHEGWHFVESPGGALHLRNGTGLCLGLDTQTNGIIGVSDASQAACLVPKSVPFQGTPPPGNYPIGLHMDAQFVMAPTGITLDPTGWLPVHRLDPTVYQPWFEWIIIETETGQALLTNPRRWLHTWNPTNRFSPAGFLNHVLAIVDHSDQAHRAPYWAGLATSVPGTSQTYGQSITAKANAWLTQFNATSPEVQAQASQVMEGASTHFYNAPTGNELDPKVPPDWPGIDDELGKDPYPG